jgi:hypothetical protein
MTHWKTTFDPDDGEPIGALCDCDIDADHDGTGDLMFPEPEASSRETREGITGLYWDNLGHGGAA